MALKLITPATALAISLAEAKQQCRVDTSDEDTLITGYIMTATQMAETAMGGRAVMPQTWELVLDEFPDAFKLTRIPAASVTSLKYYDASGAQQTLASDAYALDAADDYGPAYVVPAYSTSWPSTRDQVNAVALRYVAGYADAAAVPQPIKNWILLMVAAMHANREAETIGHGAVLSLGFADHMLDYYMVYQ